MGFFDLFKPKKEPKPRPAEPAAAAALSDGEALRAAFTANLRLLNQKEYPAEWFRGLFRDSATATHFRLGEIDLPSGELMVGDPLSYLGDPIYFQHLNRKIEPGSYPVEVTAIQTPVLGLRYAAARLVIREDAAVRYEIAMPVGKTAADYNTPGVLTGFGVDVGLAGFCDVQTAAEYRQFFAQAIEEQHNISCDYFLPLFRKSYDAAPRFQRLGGDFLIYEVPDTGHRLAMFASGFGDGFYSAYWGLDASDAVTEAVIPLIHPDVWT